MSNEKKIQTIRAITIIIIMILIAPFIFFMTAIILYITKYVSLTN